MGTEREWDGIDRRGDQEVVKYKVERIIEDMNDTKKDVESIKSDVTQIKILMTEMKMELKQIVGKSSAITSAIVSVVVAIVGAIASFYLGK